ncbi:unnamed protein product, partial [Rotaria sordida]
MALEKVRSDSIISTSDRSEHLIKKGRFSYWTRVIISILPTIIFGVFTVTFTVQQNDFFRKTREQDVLVADAQNKRLIFDNYIDVISDRLLSSQFRRNNSEHLLTIRAKTLTALRHLDAHYKSEIIFFLYENKLIREDVPEAERLDLDGADLTSVRFTRSSTRRCILPNLYLPGVVALDIVFDGCRLMDSVFNGGTFNRSQFISCSLGQTQFIDTSLDYATFLGSDLDGVNFKGTLLTNTKFLDTFVQNLTLINTDMLGSNMNDSDIILPYTERPNYIINTRFPNGSFSNIDSKQLVIDGGAEIECSSENFSSWGTIRTQQRWQYYNKDNNETNNSLKSLLNPAKGNCCFVTNTTNLVYQQIVVTNYSVLIKSGKACCNLSAYMGCLEPDLNDHVVITVRFINTLNLSYSEESLVMPSQGNGFQYFTKLHP